jgi:chaperonin GroES
MAVPTGDNILIEQEEAEAISSGGIHFVDSEAAAPNRGRVIAVGSGMMTTTGNRVPSEVKEGDRIVFDPFAAAPGAEVELNGEKYLIIREANVRIIL